jgi:putative ABC transport system permease protein
MYKLLLLLFPRDIRDEFGADMEHVFREHRRGVRGLAAVILWARAIGDAVRHGIGARLDVRARRAASTRLLAPSAPLAPSNRRFMDLFSHDFRYALRLLLKQPAVTAMMLLTLGLGIGANTAVFSVIHAVLLRALPYVEPDQLVMIHEKRMAEGVMNNPASPADFLDWARLNHSFASIAAYTETTADLTGVGDPVQLTVGGVTPAFFEVFGIRPLYGRTFLPGEDTTGRHRVVVLGHSLWQQRFGADATVIGRTITLNGTTHDVVGVLPPDFESPTAPAEIWTPLVLQTGVEAPPRASHFLYVYGRMKPSVALAAARSEMDAIGKQLEAQYPNESQGHGAHVISLRDDVVGPARRGLLVLATAVAFVLLIACTNVANLLLARAASRRRELAIRAAIGAARSRLLRQSLTESVVLAIASGALGLGVAYLMLQLLVTQTPPALRGVGLDRAVLDATVLTFTFLLCVATGVTAGLLPAWLLSRQDPGEPLREAGRAPVSLRKTIRFSLMVAEVSLTSLLLVGAGLLLRSFERVLSQPAGIETDNRLTATLTMPRTRYADSDALRRARIEIETRLRSTPGVSAVGATAFLPLTRQDARRGISIENVEHGENDPPTRAHLRIVTAGYYSAAGIRLAQGRLFTEADTATATPVVVINETMARRYFPDTSAIGKRVRFNGGSEPWRQVVGIIKDVRHWGLDRDVNPEMYLPFDQQPSSTMTFVLHTVGSPGTVVPEITRLVHDYDPNLPLGATRTMDEVASRSLAARRWSAMLLGMFALLALALAGIGIYGVMAQLVSTRTSEIGIRLTLGARPQAVLGQIIGEGLIYTLSGLALGLAVSFAVMRGLQALLFEVRPSDPLTLSIVAITVLTVAALASLGPALRAMRIDPVHALRFD